MWTDGQLSESFDIEDCALYYVRQKLPVDVYAIIRINWHIKQKLVGVSESKMLSVDEDVIAEFTEIIGTALRTGCEVCVICSEDPYDLGFELR